MSDYMQSPVQDEIDLRDLFRILWAGKWIISGVSLGLGIVAVVITLSMPNVYRSESVLAPVNESGAGGFAAIAGQLSGLASLAGVRVGKEQVSKTAIALEVMKSRLFITSFIKRHDILVPLMAGKSWDRKRKVLVLNDKKYNVKTKSWIASSELSGSGIPSDWKAYKAFSKKLKVMQSKDTGLVTVSLDSISPELAQKWLTWLIEDINEQMRERDIEEANKSIDFLKKEREKTPVAGMQQVFNTLIEKQMQTVMLANVREQYVFNVIDPPGVPEQKVSPRRAIIVIVSVILGGMFSSLVLIVLGLSRNSGQASLPKTKSN